MARPPSGATVHQLKVTLAEIAPPIWRRFQVESDANLEELHTVLQIVMGWENYHMYQFTVKGAEYGETETSDMFDVKSARKARLGQLVPSPGARFTYTYDFGDNWEHEIEVERVAPPEPGVSYPVCLEGARACPPEDCGGAWGYVELLEVLRNPEHEEYEEMREWAGEDFDPEAFDLDEVNRMLRSLRRPSRAR